MIDKLFAKLLKEHSINEIYEMDILELLRLTNLDKNMNNETKTVDSLFAAFGK